MRVDALAALIIAAVPAIGSAQSVQWIRQFGTTGHDRAAAIAVNASGVYPGGLDQAVRHAEV
jgi:hypothetical protein